MRRAEIDGASDEILRVTRRAGGATASGSRSAWDVTQFWQYEQCRSQPSMPKLKASAPG